MSCYPFSVHVTRLVVHAGRTAPPLLVLLFALTSPARAQQPAVDPPRVELWGAVAADTDTLDGDVVSTYAPPLAAGTSLSSRATQRLAVDPGFARGVEAGVNVFLTPRFGLQGLVGIAWADVSGRNEPYDVTLRYEARQPPDYVPRPYVYSQTTPWPDTAGTLRTTWWAAGAVARWWTPGGAAGGTVGGGLGFERYDGEIESLGYTSFRLGGHSVLFPFEHRVIVTPAGGGTVVRPYLRGDLHRRVGPRAALMAGVRMHFGSRRELPLRVERLLDPADAPIVPELEEVERQLGEPPLVLNGLRWHVAAGLKVWF